MPKKGEDAHGRLHMVQGESSRHGERKGEEGNCPISATSHAGKRGGETKSVTGKKGWETSGAPPVDFFQISGGEKKKRRETIISTPSSTYISREGGEAGLTGEKGKEAKRRMAREGFTRPCGVIEMSEGEEKERKKRIVLTCFLAWKEEARQREV